MDDPIKEIEAAVQKVFENQTITPRWMIYFDEITGQWVRLKKSEDRPDPTFQGEEEE